MAAKRSVAQRSGESATRATRDATKKKRNEADRSGTERRRSGEARKHEPARATIGEPTRSDRRKRRKRSRKSQRRRQRRWSGSDPTRRERESVREIDPSLDAKGGGRDRTIKKMDKTTRQTNARARL